MNILIKNLDILIVKINVMKVDQNNLKKYGMILKIIKYHNGNKH